MIGQCFRRGHLSVAALALFAVTACGSEAAGTADAADSAAPTATLRTDPATDAADTPDPRGQAERVLTESDQLFLEMADGGCNAVDFPSFFKAYSGSWAVREKYTAAAVTQGPSGKSSAQPRRSYLDRDAFPIAPMDYEFVTAASAAAFEGKSGASWRDLSYVRLEFNTAGDNRRRVDWVPGIFQKHQDPPPPDLEEGLGEMVRATGGGGTLLFYPTATCWELVEDVRNPMPQP